jgi:hypothetical protein
VLDGDEAIGAELRRRGLEVEYLRELAAMLGFAEEEGWTPEIFAAMEDAPLAQKREAALRTLQLGGSSEEGDGEPPAGGDEAPRNADSPD